MTIAMGIAANILGAAALALMSWRKTRAWAPLFGLATQLPWWCYALAGQDTWPLLIACALYTGVYAVGSWHYIVDVRHRRRLLRSIRQWQAERRTRKVNQ